MEGRKPVHTIRYGRIKVTIWANQGLNGVWHNVQVSRSYRDGDDWKQSDSFGRDDLLLVCKALDRAHTWICEEGQASQAPATES